jgi:hypothetical protein
MHSFSALRHIKTLGRNSCRMADLVMPRCLHLAVERERTISMSETVCMHFSQQLIGPYIVHTDPEVTREGVPRYHTYR